MTIFLSDEPHGRPGNAGPDLLLIDDDPNPDVRHTVAHARLRHEPRDEPPPPRRPAVGPQRPGPPRGPPQRPPGRPPPGHGGSRRGRRRGRPPPRRRHGPQGAGGVRRTLQAAEDQAGGDAGGRGEGVGQPEAARRRGAVAEHDLPLRESDAVAQQHDRPQANTASVAGGGGGPGEEQAPRPRRPQRPAGGGEEAEAHVDSGAREAQPGGLFRRAAAALGGEDRRHRREAGPEEERGARLVLQPAAETEAHEVRGAALTRREFRFSISVNWARIGRTWGDAVETPFVIISAGFFINYAQSTVNNS